MEDIKSYTCPNCGANATNADNCEYCGSLLVRFVQKGIDLRNTDYLNDSIIYPGLLAALKHNLDLQNSTNEDVVTTDVIGPDMGGEQDYITCILKNGDICHLDGSPMLCKSNKGLCVNFTFCLYIENNEEEHLTYNREQEIGRKKFESLDCFPLFSKHISYYEDDFCNKRKGYEYFIDFGEDAEGASKLISKVWNCVFDIPFDAKLEFYTNVGIDNVEQCRNNIDKELYGLENIDDDNDSTNLWAWVIVIVGALLYFIF